jgi:NitT/TauT family transport system substrate-binding protein
MRLFRLALTLFGGLVVLAGTAPAAAPAAPLPQARTVRMGMILSMSTTPVYVAIERGYMAEENLDIQIEPVQVTSQALTQVGAGNLEVANVTVGAAVLNTIDRGINIKLISGNDSYPPSGPGGNHFLVRKDLYDSGVTDASGLRGRKVGGNALGVFTEYAIDRAMRTAGMTIDDVEFVQVPFPDIPAAFANKAIDAAIVAEPFGTVAINQGTAVPILPGWLAGAQQTVIMAGPTLLDEPGLADSFMRAFLRGLRDVTAEGITPEIAAIIEKYTRVPADLVQRLSHPYWDAEGRVNWDSLMDQQRFYMARGELTYAEPIDLLAVLSDDRPRRQALATLGQ